MATSLVGVVIGLVLSLLYAVYRVAQLGAQIERHHAAIDHLVSAHYSVMEYVNARFLPREYVTEHPDVQVVVAPNPDANRITDVTLAHDMAFLEAAQRDTDTLYREFE